jgi:hypothetical protein
MALAEVLLDAQRFIKHDSEHFIFTAVEASKVYGFVRNTTRTLWPMVNGVDYFQM